MVREVPKWLSRHWHHMVCLCSLQGLLPAQVPLTVQGGRYYHLFSSLPLLFSHRTTSPAFTFKSCSSSRSSSSPLIWDVHHTFLCFCFCAWEFYLPQLDSKFSLMMETSPHNWRVPHSRKQLSLSSKHPFPSTASWFSIARLMCQWWAQGRLVN